MTDFQRPPKEKIQSVTAVTDRIKNLLERSLHNVWIEGEISNLTKHSSGHWYFTLKDEGAQVQAVMFKFANSSVQFNAESGMNVLVCGDITVYPPRGNYQIKLTKMLPVGVGPLQLAFEQLKKKLKEEGLFDSIYKKSLPFIPKQVGIVTSPTGAAIRDIINVLTRRFPNMDILLNPVRVQGDLAAQEIANAIKQMNEHTSCDVLIVGRGGGSIEDLWAFNEEVVARAIFDSSIPIVSAVGHETDFTISDFVADLRAPTPSAAAELVVPERTALLDEIARLNERSLIALNSKLTKTKESFQTSMMQQLVNRPVERIERLSQELDFSTDKLLREQFNYIDRTKKNLLLLIEKVKLLDPVETLKRGFSVATLSDTNTLVRESADVEVGSMIDLKVIDGRIRCEVKAHILEDIDGQGKIF